MAEPSARRPVALLWSGGKDSALALHALRASERYDVRMLLTTMTEGYDRISMHGVRRDVLEAQTDALGLPVRLAYIPQGCSNDDYQRVVREALTGAREDGAEVVAAGDIFLRDVRQYRERLIASSGLEALFPLWGRDSEMLARRFIRDGFRAVAVCVDTEVLDRSFTGREYGEEFLDLLPSDADLCGENGEFHTFVYDGPEFQRPVPVDVGERVLRDERFCYCDLTLSAG